MFPRRRNSGSRYPVTGRVQLAAVNGGSVLEGWALNESKGGLRAIVEEPVELGTQFTVTLEGRPARPGKVVWVQEEPDGAVIGVAFTDCSLGESVPPPFPKRETRGLADQLSGEMGAAPSDKKENTGSR